MKNSFDGLISRLNMAKERIGDSQDMLIQTAKSETQRIKKKNQKNRITKACGRILKGIKYV